MIIVLLLFTTCNAYFNNWFPIVTVSSTDFTNPKQIRMFGKDFVVWKKNEDIILQDDVCPHRCAPLSEGYIDNNSKNLRCAYHGWEFDESGENTCIPQSPNKIKSTNACVKTYQTIEHGDMLWGYFGNSEIDYLPEDHYKLTNSDTFMRELPYSFHILLENFFDPAHVHFAHHKLQSKRENGSPIDVKLIYNMNTTFTIEYEDFPKNNSTKRIGRMNFQMPCHYFLNSVKTQNDILNYIHIFIVPIQEDKTRIFIHYDFNKNNKVYKMYRFFPRWLKHMNTNLFLDSDTLILHKQEQYLNNNNSYHDHKEYYMPTTSDKSITLYKKWIKQVLPTIPYFRKIKENKELTRNEILNRYEQHTKHCTFCRDALKKSERFKILGTIFLTAAFIYTENIFLLLLALGNYLVLDKFKQQFIYKDYIHNLIK